MQVAKKFNVLELYAGTGRCVEPFREWTRTKRIALVDNNEYAARVYRANFPSATYATHDVGIVRSSELLSLSGGRVDILLGCPPCQGFSDCGLKNPRDPRNRLMTRFVEIVEDLKPKALSFENVPLVANSRRYFRFLRALERLNYVWTASIVNAALWGSCQSRQRLMLVAVHSSLGVTPKLPRPTHGGARDYFSYSKEEMCKLKDDLVGMLGKTPATQRLEDGLPHCTGTTLGRRSIPTIEETIGDLPAVGTPNAATLNHVKWNHSTPTLRRMGQIKEGARWRGAADHFSQTYGRLHRRGLSRTITAYFANAGSGRFWHPTENRSLTLREAARVQGFPDSFRFLDGGDRENCHLVGNALDKALANISFTAIRDCLS